MTDYPMNPASVRLGRRRVLGMTAAATAGMVASAGPAAAGSLPETSADPETAWRTLLAGNARFAEARQRHPHQDAERREELVDGQDPFACVLACADSRVPPEVVFDRGLGDLFTIRTAGEVLDESVVGSIEYAVEYLGVRLVVVLGHTGCGAVSAAVDLVRDGATYTGSVSTIARAIEATVFATAPQADQEKPTTAPQAERERFIDACVENQARRVTAQLTERSAIIREAASGQGVELVPAVYDLHDSTVSRR
ncbi:carbonic anhydrase [Haloechinothrix alba]|uniref:Carbonic anhydrase n=1 Tax=Haloechinothrix alba TaxID=664784 RepID=A0A238WP28_9PSEU|nr:carbonic anhydrase [Haloechinothrix alba]SNR48360.1 carbonic anhydrase [Haloechinothrix alba]